MAETGTGKSRSILCKIFSPANLGIYAQVVDLLLILTPCWWLLGAGSSRVMYGPCSFLIRGGGWINDVGADGFGFRIGFLAFPGVPFFSLLLWAIALVLNIFGVLKAKRSERTGCDGATCLKLRKKGGSLFIASGVLSILASLVYIAASFLVGAFLSALSGGVRFRPFIGVILSFLTAVTYIVAGAMLKRRPCAICPEVTVELDNQQPTVET